MRAHALACRLEAVSSMNCRRPRKTIQSSTAYQTDVKKRFHVVLGTIKDSSLRYTDHHASCDGWKDDDCISESVGETHL